MNKKDFLIILAGLIVLGLIVLASFLVPQVPEEVNIITDANEYGMGDMLKVKIENNLKKSICFSSCYPYNIEKKNGEWNGYSYGDCSNSNLNENCIDSRQVKAFEFTIPFIEAGAHRLGVSACIGCNVNQTFREDQKFYSNDFLIR